VDHLEVKHIIVVGHYGCSGVHAALSKRKVGLADNWLRHVQDVYDKHGTYLGELAGETRRHDALCEFNVVEQVRNVCHTSTVQDAWARGQILAVHGWIYGVRDGMLRDLDVTVAGAEEADAAIAASLTRLRGKDGSA
jgi:carbonic anhydrase